MLEALEAGQSYRTSSIDAPDRQETTMGSRLGEVDPGFSGTEDRLLLAVSLAKLPDRERTILQLRFVDGPHPVTDRRPHRDQPDARFAVAGVQPGQAARGLQRRGMTET